MQKNNISVWKLTKTLVFKDPSNSLSNSYRKKEHLHRKPRFYRGNNFKATNFENSHFYYETFSIFAMAIFMLMLFFKKSYCDNYHMQRSTVQG